MSHYDIHVGDVIKYPEMVMTRTVQRRGIYFGKSIDALQYYFGKIDTDGSAVDSLTRVYRLMHLLYLH